MADDKPWHLYEIITRDGSRVEVRAIGYELEYQIDARVLNLKPTSSFGSGRQGAFVDPQGIHRIDKDVGEPDVLKKRAHEGEE